MNRDIQTEDFSKLLDNPGRPKSTLSGWTHRYKSKFDKKLLFYNPLKFLKSTIDAYKADPSLILNKKTARYVLGGVVGTVSLVALAYGLNRQFDSLQIPCKFNNLAIPAYKPDFCQLAATTPRKHLRKTD